MDSKTLTNSIHIRIWMRNNDEIYKYYNADFVFTVTKGIDFQSGRDTITSGLNIRIRILNNNEQF